MKRREFSTAAAGLAMAASTFPAISFAQTAALQEGKQYRQLSAPAPVDAPGGKVEVVEFFWYNCPHCNSFEPELAAWLKTAPKNVAFRRVPIAFNAGFVDQQKLYYALEAMGKIDDVHLKVFRAIHVEKLNLSKEANIFEWVAKQPGLDAAKFKEQYKSFSVSSEMRKASQLQEAYGVEGVPAMGVAGKYYTDGTMSGGLSNMIKVVEALAAKG